MKILNLTQKTAISSDAKIAESLSDQLFGLLNPKNPRTLIFYTRFGIHTFGLKTAIAVLVINNKYKVIQKTIVKPWRIFMWNPKYGIVVELPVSDMDKVHVGDVTSFKTATREP